MISHLAELSPPIDDEKAYLPSPERIARMCAAIRRRWSEREYQKRSVVDPPQRWTAPTVSVRLDGTVYPIE